MRFLGIRSACLRKLLLALTGGAIAAALLVSGPPNPVHSGRRLSAWVEEVHKLNRLAAVVNTNHAEVQAIRAIGTNAIPWLVGELSAAPPWRWRLNALLQRQSIIRYRFPGVSDGRESQFRARAGFWALGEIAGPAIPSLMRLFEQQPEFATSALAGIGVPALPALEHYLTNSPLGMAWPKQRAEVVGHLLGGLYVAIDVGRIPKSDAAHLLPTIRIWAQGSRTNGLAGYWAGGVLSKFGLSFSELPPEHPL